MPARPQQSDDDVLAVLDAMRQERAKINALALRNRLGGGSHKRLSRLIEQWQKRAAPEEKEAAAGGRKRKGARAQRAEAPELAEEAVSESSNAATAQEQAAAQATPSAEPAPTPSAEPVRTEAVPPPIDTALESHADVRAPDEPTFKETFQSSPQADIERENAELRRRLAALEDEIRELWDFVAADRHARRDDMDRVLRLLDSARRRRDQAASDNPLRHAAEHFGDMNEPRPNQPRAPERRSE